MSQTLPQIAQAASGVGWTNPENVIGFNSEVAVTSTETNTFNCSGHDFSLVPSTIGSVGVMIGVRARKVLNTGTLPTANLIVELSWDNGSTWSDQRIVSDLTTSLADYEVGSKTDNWGHTWTQAELQSGSFLVRITADGTETGDAEWQVSHVWAQIGFEDQEPIVIGAQDVLWASDDGFSSIAIMFGFADLSVDDGGAAGAGGGGDKDLGEWELS